MRINVSNKHRLDFKLLREMSHDGCFAVKTCAVYEHRGGESNMETSADGTFVPKKKLCDEVNFFKSQDSCCDAARSRENNEAARANCFDHWNPRQKNKYVLGKAEDCTREDGGAGLVNCCRALGLRERQACGTARLSLFKRANQESIARCRDLKMYPEDTCDVPKSS